MTLVANLADLCFRLIVLVPAFTTTIKNIQKVGKVVRLASCGHNAIGWRQFFCWEVGKVGSWQAPCWRGIPRRVMRPASSQPFLARWYPFNCQTIACRGYPGCPGRGLPMCGLA
jgi:hypothetical protein